jgi:hypothetical protein
MSASKLSEAHMKKVSIIPATAYVNGRQMTATHFNVVSVSDNLFDKVVFKYTLFNQFGEWAGEAAYELSGVEQYTKWDASPEGAYKIVADGINLEITPVVGKSSIFDC